MIREAWDFLRDQFDKILLSALLCLFVCIVVFGVQMNDESVHWLREIVSSLLGGLLGLITGVRVGRNLQVDSLIKTKTGDDPKP